MSWCINLRCFIVLFLIFTTGCKAQTTTELVSDSGKKIVSNSLTYDSTIKTIHILVALCDNKYQGIVPVPAKIGNGQDPANNLYWGCAFGIKSFFKNSNDWKLLKTIAVDSVILERLTFKHKTSNTILIADAYNGQFIKQCTVDFLNSSCGLKKDTLHINNMTVGINGNAKLIAYIGHDGLMDFQLKNTFVNTDNKLRDVMILACYSKHFFSPLLQKAHVQPLLWSTGLMSPEAYTIHAALSAYLNKQPQEQMRSDVAKAYSNYQKCSYNAAYRLLTTGW